MPVYLAYDTSNTSLGDCLMQICPESNSYQPVAYFGRGLNKHERNYSITKLELLSVVYNIFRVYLESLKFTLITDHSALISILTRKPVTPQIGRFSLILQGFNFRIIHCSGQWNKTADFLSWRTYDHTSDEMTKFIKAFPDNQVIRKPSTYGSHHSYTRFRQQL